MRESRVKAIEDGKTKYSPNQGTVPLREAVCEKLKRENGVEYTPSEIVISNGAKQSVTQAVLDVLRPGGRSYRARAVLGELSGNGHFIGSEESHPENKHQEQFFDHAGTVGKSNHTEIENVDFVFAVQSERSGLFQRDVTEDLRNRDETSEIVSFVGRDLRTHNLCPE